MLGHDSVDIFKKICLALIWSFGEGTGVAAGRLGRGSGFLGQEVELLSCPLVFLSHLSFSPLIRYSRSLPT